MPRLIDYATRFGFLREAAFAVVLHDGRSGAGAPSRRSVAAALGTSVNTVRRLLSAEADLVTLAADEVARRRRFGRLGRLRDVAPEVAALHLLRKGLPDAPTRIAEELVWLRLLLSAAPAPEDRDRDGLLLRERFRIHEGRDLEDADPVTDTSGSTLVPTAGPLAHHLQEREEMLTVLVAQAVLLVHGRAEEESPDEGHSELEQELRALLEGLGLRVCLGGLTPDAAVDVLERWLSRPRLG